MRLGLTTHNLDALFARRHSCSLTVSVAWLLKLFYLELLGSIRYATRLVIESRDNDVTAHRAPYNMLR